MRANSSQIASRLFRSQRYIVLLIVTVFVSLLIVTSVAARGVSMAAFPEKVNSYYQTVKGATSGDGDGSFFDLFTGGSGDGDDEDELVPSEEEYTKLKENEEKVSDKSEQSEKASGKEESAKPEKEESKDSEKKVGDVEKEADKKNDLADKLDKVKEEGKKERVNIALKETDGKKDVKKVETEKDSQALVKDSAASGKAEDSKELVKDSAASGKASVV